MKTWRPRRERMLGKGVVRPSTHLRGQVPGWKCGVIVRVGGAPVCNVVMGLNQYIMKRASKQVDGGGWNVLFRERRA